MRDRTLLRTLALCETAILLALGTLLSLIKVFEAPMGGSITAASMLPVIVIGLRWGLKWGLGGGLAYGLLQFLVGFYAISPWALILDYLVAFGVLGFSGLFYGKKFGLIIATPICGALRFLVHYISGVVLWGMSAPEGVSVWYYSLTYNGGYMLPDILIALVAAAAIYTPLKRFWRLKGATE